MVSKEVQLNKICRHSLLENVLTVAGYYECVGLGVEVEDLPRKIQAIKTVFLVSLESLIDADKSIFPEWFNRKNAERIKNMSGFDWKDGERYCQFYNWLTDYLQYLHKL
jgi:hypothetical protein